MSMEKNRIRPSANSKKMRMSYSRQKEVLEMPNLIEVQKDSYKWFLEEGLKEVLGQDPRPQYQADEKRIYKMKFAKWEVWFRVEEKVLVVCDVLNI